jgi:hypothetical protein
MPSPDLCRLVLPVVIGCIPASCRCGQATSTPVFSRTHERAWTPPLASPTPTTVHAFPHACTQSRAATQRLLRRSRLPCRTSPPDLVCATVMHHTAPSEHAYTSSHRPLVQGLLTVNFCQPSFEFTFNVGIDLLF